MLKAIFFDFDGVILESADIKTKAFRDLFSYVPEHVDQIVDYHIANAGVNRYEKFEYIYANIIKEGLSGEKKEELSKKFSELVLKEIRICPFVPGTEDFLKRYHGILQLFVASATPEAELRDIVKERNINPYFKGVFGAPRKKSEIVLKVMQETGLKKDEIIFVGDTTADLEHARICGVGFIGRIVREKNPFPDGTLVVKDLTGLNEVVEAML